MKSILKFLFARVKTGFGRYTVAILLIKARAIYSGMFTNANFPTPEPTMPDLLTLITNLQDTQSAAENGGTAEIKARDEAKAALIAALKTLGNYVNFTGNGSAAVLATSGFDLYKTKEPVQLQPVKHIFVTSVPNTNSLVIRAVGAKGAKGFVHQYTADPAMADNSWISVNNTVRNYTFSGLTRGKEYFVRVQAIGSNGQVAYSDTISRIVQ